VPYDVNSSARKAFEHTTLQNPLRKLDNHDRTTLWAMLRLYAAHGRKKINATDLQDVPKLLLLVSAASKMSKELQLQLFEGPLSQVLQPLTDEFADLPLELARLSSNLRLAIETMGKSGHHHQSMANLPLIQASLFVYLKTGHHSDEHLAELFQAIGGGPMTIDMSGDAIRKKRNYMMLQLPKLYNYALEEARQKCSDQPMRDHH
jgi:hypothetical protein